MNYTVQHMCQKSQMAFKKSGLKILRATLTCMYWSENFCASSVALKESQHFFFRVKGFDPHVSLAKPCDRE